MARLLVVDDDPDIRELVRFTLEACGHELLTAPDGEAGLRPCANTSPTSFSPIG